MYVQSGSFWFPAKYAELLNEVFLKTVGEVILCAEKDDSSLRDYRLFVTLVL